MTETTHDVSEDSMGGIYRCQYDRLDDEPLSVTVATAVATALGVDVTTLDPLHYAINADALERLFEPRADGLRSGGTVTFDYNGCAVTITSEGEITVEHQSSD